MKMEEIGLATGNLFTYVLAGIQAEKTFQIIELVLAIVTSLVLLAYRVWKWWKEAQKDGKITKEEIKDGLDIVKGGIEDVQQILDENKKKGEKKDGEK